MSWIVLAAAVVALLVAGVVYLAVYLKWEQDQTTGMAYYGRPLAARRALKARMRRLSRPVRPVVRLLARGNRHRTEMPGFVYEGVAGPTRVSSPDVFARAKAYRPRPEDVFVVTQMRCGTTWMQQLVYETVTRGHGTSDRSDGHLYAISPWIDAVNSVSMDDAPLVGERPTRIIKSHLPVSLCPYGEQAKYIYVTRHPVSCFASIVDYNRSLLGPLTPPIETMADWYCSDRMYWLPWPRHVEGWWQWSVSRGNVLFVHFEKMKSDLAGVVDQVARFLGYALEAEERARVAERCSFDFMQAHEEFFEMAPPTMFSVSGGKFLASGKAARHEDVTPAVRQRILDYCREVMSGGQYPLQQFYPDIVSGKTPEVEPRGPNPGLTPGFDPGVGQSSG
jgi:aryl sulfotransferase